MREIGSEFWDVSIIDKHNSLFPEFAQWFLSGRSALWAIIKELKNCHSVAMPSWCCDSMIKPFVDAGMEIHFYPVFWEKVLVQEISLNTDVLFLMDYFGYTGPQPDLSAFKGVVIRDVTHSLFSDQYSDADYYFGSLRKWCGVWTGGYAWTNNGHAMNFDTGDDFGYTALREKAMLLKNSYLHGFVDNKGQRAENKGYLKLFEQAEEKLEHIGAIPAAERDVYIACQIDVDSVKSRRRQNAEILRAAIPDWLMFPELEEKDCPMFVPILVPGGKRDALRRYLINNEMYCPIHWPISAYHRLDERTEYIYKNELSLVCDQRYIEDDMNRMVEVIRAFLQEV